MARIHLVDALPYVFRAYFSIPPTMKSPDGRSVNAAWGFGMFLLKLMADEKITHLAVAFDESLNSSFRNEFYPGYKASRELPPPELEAQLKDCQELARLTGAFVTASPHWEADDLIATIAHRLSPAGDDIMPPGGDETIIVSSDKDLAQLVGGRTTLYDLGKNERLGAAEVKVRLGVPPERVPDLLGLMGDAVDDIPGVPGVGPKTAAALIDAFGTVESVYERLGEIAALPIRGAKTLRAKIEPHREQALLSKRLAIVKRDCPMDVTLADLVLKAPDEQAIGAFCDRLGFGAMRKKLITRA